MNENATNPIANGNLMPVKKYECNATKQDMLSRQESQDKRIDRLEKFKDDTNKAIYGTGEVDGEGGIAGMLRQVKQSQVVQNRIMWAILSILLAAALGWLFTLASGGIKKEVSNGYYIFTGNGAGYRLHHGVGCPLPFTTGEKVT